MSRQQAPRIHRLPQRLDYTLIPAPLDLSLPLASEKSPLPAIIVTPSSPSSAQDFSIAFLAPPKEPGVIERLVARVQWTKSSTESKSTFGVRAQTARTLLIIFLILFVMLTHVVTHRMAQTSRRPHLDFTVQEEQMDGVDILEGLHGSLDHSAPSAAFGGGHGHGSYNSGAHRHAHGGWFDLGWGDEDNEDDAKRDFVILT